MSTYAEVPRTRTRWPGPLPPRRLTASHRRLLRRQLGLEAPAAARSKPGQVRVAASRLSPDALAELRTAVGAAYVRTDAAERVRHAGGMSYLDLLHRRSDAAIDVPDAVARPGSHDEVLALLAACARRDVAVVPYGGGTSVVGGVQPRPDRHAGVVALDLSGLDRLVAVDDISRTVTLQPGVTGPRADRLLAPYGLTLGHVPQSWECSTVGGWVATRSAGQASTGVGRIDDLVLGLRMATPRGTLELDRGPRSAAGPDLRQLVTGSEGAFGVVTEVTLRARRIPTVRRYDGWSFPDLASGLTAVRRLVQEGVAPDVVRLSDAGETAMTLALAGRAGRALSRYQRVRGHRGGCLAVLGWEGTSARVVRARRTLAGTVVRGAGGVPLGSAVGTAWRRGRFDAPYVRDALLDAGALAETLETATSWSRLPDLHAAVTGAVRDSLAGQGTPPVVLAHVSHAYPAGAALYVTVLARRAADPYAQWRTAKAAAMAAIVASGATITHHHAVGADHAPWLADEVGELGVEVLRAVKDTLDPTGILNPGVLLPDPS